METDREQRKHGRAKTQEESGVLETGQASEGARERKRGSQPQRRPWCGDGDSAEAESQVEREQDGAETHRSREIIRERPGGRKT